MSRPASSFPANHRPNPDARARDPSFRLPSLARSGAGCSAFGAGSGTGGSPRDCTRRQNGVNTLGPRPSLLRMRAGAASRSPGKLCALTPIAASIAASLIGHRPMRRLRDLVPEHRAGLRLAREIGDDPCRGPLAQHERGPHRRKAVLQRPQRLRQPPARRAAKRTRLPARAARHSLRRIRRGKSRARRILRRHARRDDRKGGGRRETRRCRGKRM